MFYMLRRLMKLLLNLLLRKFFRPHILGLCQALAKCIAALRICLFYQQDSSYLDTYWTVVLKKSALSGFLVLLYLLFCLKPCCRLNFNFVGSSKMDNEVNILQANKFISLSVYLFIYCFLFVYFKQKEHYSRLLASVSLRVLTQCICKSTLRLHPP